MRKKVIKNLYQMKEENLAEEYNTPWIRKVNDDPKNH